MYSRWKEFSVYLHVETRITNEVYKRCLAIVEDCFIEMTHRWLCGEEGTGDLPRTWKTVFEALKLTGFPLLVKDVREALLQGKFSGNYMWCRKNTFTHSWCGFTMQMIVIDNLKLERVEEIQ